MPVPYPNFASATTSIPLSQLDNNFATTITLGNVAVQLGNTVTTIGNVTLTNTTISGLSGGSANGVVYINSSNVAVASPAVLAFDGTNLGLGVTPSAWSLGKALEVGAVGNALWYAGSTTDLRLNCNVYYNSGYKYGANGYATYYSMANGAHTWYNAASGNASSAITFTQAMTLDASSNLQVGGTVNPTSARVTPSVSGDGSTLGNPMAFFYNNTVGANAVYTWRANASRLTLSYSSQSNYTSYTDLVSFDTSGNLLVGITSYSAQNANYIALQTSGGNLVTGHASGTPSGYQYAAYLYNAGVIGSITQNGTTGVLYNLTSDYRLKNNQEALTGAKDFIMALKPKKWQWWDGSGEGVGFVAHEFMEVAKYSGHGEKDAVDADGKPVYQSIQPSSSEVMANLVSFIQEQQAMITTLQTQVTALQAKVGV